MSDMEVLRKQVRQMQEALERKNRELDALHFVWCDGGCETGTHRWTEQSITEDVVAEAERNTRRLRTWFENYKHREVRGWNTPRGPAEQK